MDIGGVVAMVLLGLAGIALTITLSWSILPRIITYLLKRKYDQYNSWWYESLNDYKTFKKTNPESNPLPSDKGDVGAIGIWLKDTVRLAQEGILSQEKAQAAEDAGAHIVLVDEDSVDVDNNTQKNKKDKNKKPSLGDLPRETETAEQYGLKNLKFVRLLLVVLVGVGFVVCVLYSAPIFVSICLFTIYLILLVIAICDIRARVIPFECCILVFVLAAICQFAQNGINGVIDGLASALIWFLGFWIINKIWHIFGQGTPVGAGDMRIIPGIVLACGLSASLFGFVFCSLTMFAWAILCLITKKAKWRDKLPMGPFLVIWFIAGMLAPSHEILIALF